MSKTTKALAILGVVAGLGVAALPFNVMAATDRDGVTVYDGEGEAAEGVEYDGDEDKDVSDTITVRTMIKDSLSIQIVGDDDADGETGQNHLVLLGDDGTIKNGSNAQGAAKITVATNNLGGYKVNMKGEETGFNGQNNASEKFAPVTNDTATFPTTGASVFGYQTTKEDAVTNVTLASGNWNGLNGTTDILIATGAKATELNGDTFTITFQAHASESQAADTYDEVVTVTATTNLSAGA